MPNFLIFDVFQMIFYIKSHECHLGCCSRITAHYVFGAQKNRIIETVLFSKHNICVFLEIRIIIFNYTLLSGGLVDACLPLY